VEADYVDQSKSLSDIADHLPLKKSCTGFNDLPMSAPAGMAL